MHKRKVALVTGSATDPGASFTTPTVNTYLPAHTTLWLVSLLQSASITRQQSGDARIITRTRNHTYDANTGWITSETTQAADTALKLTTSYTRGNNPFGLVNDKTQTWIDPLTQATISRTETTLYDTNGRFPVTVRNALDHSEQRTFDGGSGARTRLTGPNQLSTTWTIDGFGRPLVELRADGNETRTYYKQCQSDCPPGATQVQLREHFHGNDRIAVPELTYQDSVGHVLRRQTWGFDGRAILVDQRYDNLGRLAQTDQAHPIIYVRGE